MNTNTSSYAGSESEDERSTVVSAGSDGEEREGVPHREPEERCRAGASLAKSSTSGGGVCGPAPSSCRQTDTSQKKPSDCKCQQEQKDLCNTQRSICEIRKRLSKQLNCEVDEYGNCVGRKTGDDQKHKSGENRQYDKRPCESKCSRTNKRSCSKPGNDSGRQVKAQVQIIQEELCKLDKRRLQLLRCLERHQNASIKISCCQQPPPRDQSCVRPQPRSPCCGGPPKTQQRPRDQSCERPQPRSPCCGGPPKMQQRPREQNCERHQPKPCPVQQPKPCAIPQPKPCPVQQPKPCLAQQPKPCPPQQPKPCPSEQPKPCPVNDECGRREPDNNSSMSPSRISLTAGGSYDRLECSCKKIPKCEQKPCKASILKCGQPKCDTCIPKCGQPKCESSTPKCGQPKCESSTPKCERPRCESLTPKCGPRCGASSEPKSRASDNRNTICGSCAPPKPKVFNCNCRGGR